MIKRFEMLCLSVAMGLLFWPSETRSREGATNTGGCLPGKAGEVVSRLYARGEIQAAVPGDWKLQSADIERTELVISFTDGRGKKPGVRLVAPGRPDARARGRWFAYVPFGDVTADAQKALISAAGAVDAAYESSPWIPCAEGGKAPVEPASLKDPDQSAGALSWHDRLFVPAWLFVVLGAIQVLILLGGTMLVLTGGFRESQD